MIRARTHSTTARCLYLLVAAALSLSLHALALVCLSLVMVEGSLNNREDFGRLAEYVTDASAVPLPVLTLERPTALEAVKGSAEVFAGSAGLVMPEVPDISPPELDAFGESEGTMQSEVSSGLPIESRSTAEGILGIEMLGREDLVRPDLLPANGGWVESDQAIDAGIRWLLAHQLADGSWRFDHRQACGHECRNPGHHGSTTAATALGLLPLLGAGHSRCAGESQQAVARAIAYLRSRLIETPYGGDLQEGDMFGQGLATLALCEALAMTDDQELRRTCQLAVDYIVYAQNERGGWRYFPKQPGDMTMLGWQVMALKAAERAGIEVPQGTWDLAEGFLDRLQSDGGAAYGYQLPEPRPTTTAIGLLTRMQMGWPRTDERLQSGIARLEELGPSSEDIYFNYYATRALCHYQGSSAERWRTDIRDRLIASQARDGYEAGSWYFADAHTLAGGRLCDTALALLTLEAIYRQRPLFSGLSSGSSP